MSAIKVETYECEELKASEATTMAADAEAIELIERLGLEGQRTLTNPETSTREPYREMTALEAYVWRAICPQTTRVEHYKLSPIPLRVLQVVAYARELGIYEALEVWHPRKVVDDPLLVGVPKGERYSNKRHLIARWGETLVPFEQLVEKAKNQFAVELTAKLGDIQNELDKAKANLKNRVELAFAHEKFELPSAYNVLE